MQETLDVLCQGIVAVRKSGALHYAMTAALAIGNFINATTPRGRAWGFRLDTLAKLSEAKAADRSTTLIDILVRLPDARGTAGIVALPDELAVLTAAKSLSFEQVSRVNVFVPRCSR
jgi:hypothetical protein